jgi:hypothetical protein
LVAILAKPCARFDVKNQTKKTNEAQLLDLLKKVLPKATHDAQLAGEIYQAVELELNSKTFAGSCRAQLPRVCRPCTGRDAARGWFETAL